MSICTNITLNPKTYQSLQYRVIVVSRKKEKVIINNIKLRDIGQTIAELMCINVLSHFVGLDDPEIINDKRKGIIV